jgi:5-methylcytosine-specific restriction endonuclease McrA
MPTAALQPCREPRCPALVEGGGRCPAHARPRLRQRPRVTGVRLGYYTARWGGLRQRVLAEAAHTCAQCGGVSLDLDVDHRIPHRGDAALFWDVDNLQALCPRCHGRKSAAGL